MSRTWAAAPGAAMTINSIGIDRRPFPVWADVADHDGVIVLNLGPLSGRELMKMIGLDADRRLLLFDAAHATVTDFTASRPLPATLTACLSRLTADFESFGDDEVAALPAVVAELLSETHVYGYSLVDLPEWCDPVEFWSLLSAHDWKAAPALAMVGADFYASIHDECYAYVELRYPSMATRLIAALIAKAVSHAAAGEERGPEIEEHEPPVVDGLLAADGAFVLDLASAEVREGEILIGFARQRWVPPDSVPACTDFVRFDRVTKRYALLSRRPFAVMRVHAAFTIAKRETCISGTFDFGTCHRRYTVEWQRQGQTRSARCEGVALINAGPGEYVGLFVGDVDPDQFAEGDVVLIYEANEKPDGGAR